MIPFLHQPVKDVPRRLRRWLVLRPRLCNLKITIFADKLPLLQKILNRAEKARLMELSEKELFVEMILELKRISEKCDEIGRKIVIWSN